MLNLKARFFSSLNCHCLSYTVISKANAHYDDPFYIEITSLLCLLHVGHLFAAVLRMWHPQSTMGERNVWHLDLSGMLRQAQKSGGAHQVIAVSL